MPVTKAGFTVFWTVAGTVTSLTCTSVDTPGSTCIAAHRLTSIALACMWITMNPMTIVAFCRRECGTTHSPPAAAFWRKISAPLSFAVCPSTVLTRASLYVNPWQSEFVLAAAHRLHCRASSHCVDAFVNDALNGPWVSSRQCAWPAAVSRWIGEFNIDFEIVKQAAAATFSIYDAHLRVARMDAIFLLLLCLFRSDGLGWGERTPREAELPSVMVRAFRVHSFVHTPVSPPIHSLLARLPVTAGSA